MMRRTIGLVMVVLAASGVSCKEREKPAPTAADLALVECDGGKVDPRSDPANCGFCGNACTAVHGKTSCVDSRCVPVCDPGWATCSDSAKACNRDVTRDPHACGACDRTCKGTACVGGECQPEPTVVARDVSAWGIRASDGTYLYLVHPNEPSKWSRLRLSDGKLEHRNGDAQFAPAAFDGTHLYGCRTTHVDPTKDPPCELRKRVGDGPESDVAKLDRPLFGGVLAVRDGTLYWARTLATGTFEGNDRGPFADIVALDLSTKAQRIVAPHELAPMQIVVGDTDLYWITSGTDRDGTGVRKVAIAGGTATTLAPIVVARGLSPRGGDLLASGVEGLFRVPLSGGTAELVLFGAPPGVPAQEQDDVGGVAVVGDDVYWTVDGKESGHETVLRARLP